jgi:hypothetical protein
MPDPALGKTLFGIILDKRPPGRMGFGDHETAFTRHNYPFAGGYDPRGGAAHD